MMRAKVKKLYRSGFTLIELVVVMAIVAIIAVLIVGIIAIAKKGADESKLIGDAKTIKNALIAYSQNHNGEYPAASLSTGGAFPAYDLVKTTAPGTDKIRYTLADYNDPLVTTNVDGILRSYMPGDPDSFKDANTTDHGFLCFLRTSTYCPTGFCLWVVPTSSTSNQCSGTLGTYRNTKYWFSIE